VAVGVRAADEARDAGLTPRDARGRAAQPVTGRGGEGRPA
jgi:hypothetical protein